VIDYNLSLFFFSFQSHYFEIIDEEYESDYENESDEPEVVGYIDSILVKEKVGECTRNKRCSADCYCRLYKLECRLAVNKNCICGCTMNVKCSNKGAGKYKNFHTLTLKVIVLSFKL